MDRISTEKICYTMLKKKKSTIPKNQCQQTTILEISKFAFRGKFDLKGIMIKN